MDTVDSEGISNGTFDRWSPRSFDQIFQIMFFLLLGLPDFATTVIRHESPHCDHNPRRHCALPF